VRNDLAIVIATAITYQAMVGTGRSNTPEGVLHQTRAIGNACRAR
jgi:hypothetical protein